MRLMIAVFALAMTLFAGQAAAQTSQPSPEALAAARDLVVASHAADRIRTFIPLMVQQLRPAIVQGRADAEKAFDVIVPILLESFNGRLQEFTDLIAGIYARNFTIAELSDITAFYKTPTGQKLLEKLPAVLQESMTSGQQFAQSLAADMQQRIVEEMKKRGYEVKL